MDNKSSGLKMNKTVELTSDDLKNIKVVLDYLLDSEQKHYEEYCGDFFNVECKSDYDFILQKEFYNNPKIEHIYAFARRMKDAIGI